MVNKVILIGNLGADPELRNTAGGTAVCTLRVATSDRRKDASGNWTDHTEWHQVVCWSKTAENVAKYMRKGGKLYVEGRLQTRKWTDKDGRDRYQTEVVAENVRFLGSKGEGGGERREDRTPEPRGQDGYPNDPPADPNDMPF